MKISMNFWGVKSVYSIADVNVITAVKAMDLILPVQ